MLIVFNLAALMTRNVDPPMVHALKQTCIPLDLRHRTTFLFLILKDFLLIHYHYLKTPI